LRKRSDSDTEYDSQYGLHEIALSELMLKELVGIGGFAEVYRGIWKQTEVAIKKLKIHTNKDLIEGLLSESRMLADLRHKNIIEFVGVCTEPDNFCMITEFMSRGNLFDLLHNDKNADSQIFQQSWTLKLKSARDVAHGMNFLHSHNPIIIHRDLKSHNLLLDAEWNTKVCDFGISRFKEITATMTQVGTPQWMAKEVLLGERYSEKADTYSYGVVLWECVSGKKPFEDVNPLRVISMVAHESFKLPIPETCPEKVKELIQLCFSEDPENRPTFSHIVEVLDNVTPEDFH